MNAAVPSLYVTDINPKQYYGCALELDKADKRHRKLHKQRNERGFDDSETWCLRSAILQFTLPRLRRFKEIAMAYPSDLTEQRWDAMLDEMIFAIDAVLKDDGWDFPKKGNAEEEALRDRILAGMRLFHERFFCLWW